MFVVQGIDNTLGIISFFLFGFETWRNLTLKLNGVPKLQICTFRNSFLRFWAVFLWLLTKVLPSEGEDAAVIHDRHYWLFLMLLFASLQRSERQYREPRSTEKTSSSPVYSLIHHNKDSCANLRPEISHFLYMKSVIIVISFQLEYYFSFFFFFAVWWVRFKPSAGRWKGKVELLFSPKKFCSCQGVFDTSLMAENKDRTRCPGWISESTRTLHGQLLLGELGAKWGKQGHYLAILKGFSEGIIHWIMHCLCWASVGFGRRGWLSSWLSQFVTLTVLCDCHTIPSPSGHAALSEDIDYNLG